MHLRGTGTGEGQPSQTPACPPGSLARVLQDTALAGGTAALGSWLLIPQGSSDPRCALMLENRLQGNIFSKQVEMEVETAAILRPSQRGDARARSCFPGTPLLKQDVERLHGEGVESPPSPEGLEGPLGPRRRAGSDLTAWVTSGGRGSFHHFPPSSHSLWSQTEHFP